MNINRSLNFVIPIYDNDNKLALYVHATPIDRAVFEHNYRVIAQTFTSIYAGGLGATGGPRVAALLLREHAEDAGGDDPQARKVARDAVDQNLFAEIHRLTSVVSPGPGGWVTLPYDDALRQGMISEDDAAEVENSLAFFTVASRMHLRNEVASVLAISSKLWSAQTSYLNCTEFAASLPTSREVVSIGEIQPIAEKPSSVAY